MDRKYIIIITCLSALLVGFFVYLGIKYFSSRDSAENISSNESSISSENTSSSSSSSLTSDKNKVSLIFAGDMMTDRGVDCRYEGEKFLTIFDNIDKSKFTESDFAFLNLEGPIAQGETEKVCSGSLVFNMPPRTLDLLQTLGIDSVSLANNHSLNAGNKGFIYTKELLKTNDIDSIGKYEGFDESSVGKYEINGQKFAIIAVDILAGNVDLKSKLSELSLDGYFTIIYPHWGTEYATTHNSNQEYLAHRWIDQGANMVVGGHPHVTQDIEIYKDKLIVYSLGNFVFDQAFSTETQRGLVVAIELDDEKISVDLKPTKLVLFRPQFYDDDSESKERLEKLFVPVLEYLNEGKIVLER